MTNRGPSKESRAPGPATPTYDADKRVTLRALTGVEYELLVAWLKGLMTTWRARGTVLSPVEQALVVALLFPSPRGSECDDDSTVGRGSGCTTTEASQRLGISRRAVRMACSRGDLRSRAYGRRGLLLIEERSVDEFARRRAARAAESTQDGEHRGQIVSGAAARRDREDLGAAEG